MNDPAARRRALLAHMKTESTAGRHCGNCSGVCCTFVANSIQISPVEAMDLYRWLKSEGRWDAGLEQKLTDCIAHFRLDREPPGDGQRNFVRRRYTCPFFAGGPNGCTVDPEHKPYGCLAFNPKRAGLTAGGHCESDEAPLLEREAADREENQSLRRAFGLDWEKCPIPAALLEIARNVEAQHE